MRAGGPCDGAPAEAGQPTTPGVSPRGVTLKIGRAEIPRLYAIADGDALLLEERGGQAVVDAVDAMASAGVGWIQLRLKNATDRQRFEIADASQRRLDGSPTALWIDDRPDLAAVVGAAGVHVGQHDLSPASARAVVGEGTWIGLSCHGTEHVEAADSDPDVDVVAIGPIFQTRSKERPDPTVGLAGVEAARRATAKPLVAIGGIDGDRAEAVLGAGADSVVMLGALCRGDVVANCRRWVAALGDGPSRNKSVGN